MANQGPSFGLHRDCRIKAQQKFELGAAVASLRWIESILGRRLGDRDVGQLRDERDVAQLLKDGTALCEVMNHIQPGAIQKYHKKPSAFQQMENVELFLKACVNYGMQKMDTFNVKELYEARAVYTVINCIYALGSLAQTRGYTGPKLGVKMASRNERHFDDETLQQGRCVISRQHGGPAADAPPASQAKMTPYGLPRQIILSSSAASDVVSSSHGVIGLQYGSNQVASQSGMTAYGMPRQISVSTSSDGDGDFIDSTSVNGDTPTPTTNNDTNINNINNNAATTPTLTLAPTPKPTTATKATSTSPPTPRKLAHNPILTNNPPLAPRRAKTPSASSAVIGLQYGSNRVASQSGMTAYGMPRQIISSSTSSVTSAEGVEETTGDGGDVFRT